jgi:hypothetical protein
MHFAKCFFLLLLTLTPKPYQTCNVVILWWCLENLSVSICNSWAQVVGPFRDLRGNSPPGHDHTRVSWTLFSFWVANGVWIIFSNIDFTAIWGNTSHAVGNGEETFLLWDKWHPRGPLAKKYGTRLIYETENSSDAKVSTLIVGDEWQ